MVDILEGLPESRPRFPRKEANCPQNTVATQASQANYLISSSNKDDRTAGTPPGFRIPASEPLMLRMERYNAGAGKSF